MDKKDKNEAEDISCADENNPKNVKAGGFSSFFEWTELFFVYISVGLLFLLLVFRHSPVIGKSMNPTLSDGDILLVSKLPYTPKTGDIVVCQSEIYGLETPLVKRVIATGGQTVTIDYDNWTVSVDGVTLEEEYLNMEDGVKMKRSDYLDETFTVPDGFVFVMGDNRNHSNDSRFKEVGMIDERYILGKIKFRILPLKDAGGL